MQRACATFTLCLSLGEPPPVCHSRRRRRRRRRCLAHLSAPSSVDCTFYLRIYLHIFSHGSSPGCLPYLPPSFLLYPLSGGACSICSNLFVFAVVALHCNSIVPIVHFFALCLLCPPFAFSLHPLSFHLSVFVFGFSCLPLGLIVHLVCIFMKSLCGLCNKFNSGLFMCHPRDIYHSI